MSKQKAKKSAAILVLDIVRISLMIATLGLTLAIKVLKAKQN